MPNILSGLSDRLKTAGEEQKKFNPTIAGFNPDVGGAVETGLHHVANAPIYIYNSMQEKASDEIKPIDYENMLAIAGTATGVMDLKNLGKQVITKAPQAGKAAQRIGQFTPGQLYDAGYANQDVRGMGEMYDRGKATYDRAVGNIRSLSNAMPKISPEVWGGRNQRADNRLAAWGGGTYK